MKRKRIVRRNRIIRGEKIALIAKIGDEDKRALVRFIEETNNIKMKILKRNSGSI